MNMGMENHKGYFAPRLGIAYRLTEKDRPQNRLWHQLHAVPGQQIRWTTIP